MDQYLKITVPCQTKLAELLIAELSLINFDSFQETEKGLEAFILEKFYDNNLLVEVLNKYDISAIFKVEMLENINWNEEWEKNFKPVFIDEKVQIRASFHKPKSNFKYDIIVNPKMSFGTGHHETTSLIVAEQLKINHQGKSILDLGTGTGILAIMAYKLGAKAIVATDTDTWCIENSRDNFELNQVKNFEILKGSIDKLTLPDLYDVIYANINKNVLIDELPAYSKLLAKNGIIVLSGFYSNDIDDLKEKAIESKLHVTHIETINAWAMMRLTLTPV